LKETRENASLVGVGGKEGVTEREKKVVERVVESKEEVKMVGKQERIEMKTGEVKEGSRVSIKVETKQEGKTEGMNEEEEEGIDGVKELKRQAFHAAIAAAKEKRENNLKINFQKEADKLKEAQIESKRLVKESVLMRERAEKDFEASLLLRQNSVKESKAEEAKKIEMKREEIKREEEKKVVLRLETMRLETMRMEKVKAEAMRLEEVKRIKKDDLERVEREREVMKVRVRIRVRVRFRARIRVRIM
jgi:hypothetical protein